MRRARRRRDAGGVPIDAVIVAPGVVLLILLAVVGGRIQTAAGTVDAAARAAARTASLARSVDGMESAARESAQGLLAQEGVHCRRVDIAVQHGELTAPAGQLDTVRVTVSCEIPLADLSLVPGLPGAKTLVGEFTSVVDRFRGR
ncbi:pilus assembly protein [Kitasatospora sp. NPDC050543]|uniref:pilus assembly protein n=1 Tax=Kitasatospora sp. NPDC050543 TaxID=3364054 RepID=UPI00379549F1